MFFILLPLKMPPTISIDFDWFYRKGAKLFYNAMDKTFNSLNKAAELTYQDPSPAIAQFVIVAPATLTVMLLRPVWRESLDADEKSLKKREEEPIARFSPVIFPVAYSAIFVPIFIGCSSSLAAPPLNQALGQAGDFALHFHLRIESLQTQNLNHAPGNPRILPPAWLFFRIVTSPRALPSNRPGGYHRPMELHRRPFGRDRAGSRVEL